MRRANGARSGLTTPGAWPRRSGTNDSGGKAIPITKQDGGRQHQAVLKLADAPADSPTPAARLGEVLVAQGLITEDQLGRAIAAQKLSLAPLGAVLVKQGAVNEDRMTQVLSIHLDAPIADLRDGAIDADVADSVPEDFARRHVVLPLRRDARPGMHVRARPGFPTNWDGHFQRRWGRRPDEDATSGCNNRR